MPRTYTYHWEWHVKSPPEKFWQLIADTNRFNFDTSVPSITKLPDENKTAGLYTKLQLKRFGIPVTWYEEPFEWVFPERFGVIRRYTTGPVKEMRVTVLLAPEGSGTHLTYHVEAVPANILGNIAIPVQIGLISAKEFDKTVKKYDSIIQSSPQDPVIFSSVRSPILDENRCKHLLNELNRVSLNERVNQYIEKLLRESDDFVLSKIRPYAFARQWGASKSATLAAFLHATRLGLFDLHWDILCPLCRGTQSSPRSIQDVHTPVHCDSCNINFEVNFDRLVEITFKPNSSIKNINVDTFCIGGPQVTPHIVAQQIIPANGSKKFRLKLEPGAYRVRTNTHANGTIFRAEDTGEMEYTIIISASGIESDVISSESLLLTAINSTRSDELCIIERMQFADDAVTAAELTALQIFRDLFSSEALRPGEHISVGKAALVFTDLKNSTKMYRQIGDAKAFGYVMNHFDILKTAISENEGAVVKTIGDAVMGVFLEPANAVKAMLMAKVGMMQLAAPSEEVLLKTGIHFGACIAVNLNNNFDYFGSTVNIAARLEGLSSGTDIIISGEVFDDPSVKQLLSQSSGSLQILPFETKLKGFENEAFALYRIKSI